MLPRTIRSATVLVLLANLLPTVLAAATWCTAPAMSCFTSMATKRVCTETRMGGTSHIGMGTMGPVFNSNPSGAATCNHTLVGMTAGTMFTLKFIARRPLTAPTAAGCNFTGTFYPAALPSLADTFQCTIDQSSGLPVELMDFAVEPR